MYRADLILLKITPRFEKALKLLREMIIKFTKIPLIIILLFASFQIYFGQEQTKAELFDEFGKITWEDLAARIDNLLHNLSQKPNSSAYVVIHNGKVLNDRERFRYEQWVKGQIKSREFDEKRIFIIRAEDKGELQIKLWIVPEETEKPLFTEVKWNAVLSPNTKPFIFTTTEWNNGLATPAEYLSLDLFSEYLEANPTSRGHFVIKARSKEEFRKEQSEIKKLLTEKYKITSERLRFFYIKETESGWDYLQVEVWLVPQKLK